MERDRLADYLNDWLEISRFKDYSPNGLQVEGKAHIQRVAVAVTATRDVIDQAANWGADALIVHHGWFWRGEDSRVLGYRHRRLRALLMADINLFAFHLPLDVHKEVGNNICFGREMAWPEPELLGEQQLIARADLPHAVKVEAMQQHITLRLERQVLVVGATQRPICRLAWCTGAAQDMILEAASLGADAFVSGEISERTTYLARELGVSYFAAGHYATERYGVQALAEHLEARFQLQCCFIEDPNPA
ncbi:MAG: Nif3-like dinuclear metal center hexameric protein [Betaproteobacteria bacterium]|nr:Nif3-like dinuclear metal center hexameric protein [Pseudomonadota bacterium]NBO12874.1 Nif3-like dinuclear metal center hexameric protein [Betaproteobacteria bacterium]NBO43802.1 Nif3-like dinuclear metal center hexameric protein [Betaproteobacteria bacterium]NBP10168.1 Nif3-like dinuclear metal center hexameric protein [Betaproteobacteria bacterium]NBP61197.1 Nif3-like dinuclear metal center hexameric protein [Betaproteobacteria bacterium]